MPNEHALRILVITSHPLLDANNNPIRLLDVEEERRRIRVALQRADHAVHLRLLEQATSGAIVDALADQWDIVHFTGHGANDGRILLEDEYGVGQLVDAHDLARMFGTPPLPQIVVLSLCYSARTAATALRDAGIRTVIAIEADQLIADQAAIIFNQQFYAMLARGATVGSAFERAQAAVAFDSQVGDAYAPLDEDGQPEVPWSQRFILFGNYHLTFASRPQQDAVESKEATLLVGNLPARSTNFVGRAREIVEIVKAFEADKTLRVAILGAGGIGKTELAQAVAWWYIERGRVEALVWASASNLEEAYPLSDLASLLLIARRTFNLDVSGQMPFDEQKRIVREFLGSHRTLVILDNWETLVANHTAQEVWDFVLALPNTVRVLVTSRRVLPPRNTSNIELGTLTPADAARLFVAIAHRAGYFRKDPQLIYEELGLIDQICQWLGGHALAIEVTAARTGKRSLDEIWEGLRQFPREVLQSKDEITDEPRGIWTSLDLSYNDLRTEEQALFRQLSILLAPATVDDIAAITQARHIREALEAMIDCSLVRRRDGTYALLPIVRQYADGRLAETEEDLVGLYTRAANYYGTRRTLENALLSSDYLLALFARCRVFNAAQNFVKFVHGFYPTIAIHGYWAEARRKAEQLMLIAQFLEDRKIEAYATGELANRYFDIGEYEAALGFYQGSLKIEEELGNKSGVANKRYAMGRLAQKQSNYREAERLYDQGLKLYRELDNKFNVAQLLHAKGVLAQQQGSYENAARLLRESLKLKQSLKDEYSSAYTLTQLGQLAQVRGNIVEAKLFYEQSLRIMEKYGDKHGSIIVLHCISLLEQDQGNYAKAVELVNKILEHQESVEDKSGAVNSLAELGQIAQAKGDLENAERLLREALRMAEELGEPHKIGILKGSLGNYEYLREDYSEAERLFNESLKLHEELRDQSGIAASLAQMSQVALARYDMDRAMRLSEDSLNLVKRIGEKGKQTSILQQMGNIKYLQSDFGAAIRFYDQALHIAGQLGDKDGVASAQGQLGKVAHVEGRLKDALTFYLRAFAIFEELGTPNQQTVLVDIASVRDQVGDSRFMDWIKAISKEERGIRAEVYKKVLGNVKSFAQVRSKMDANTWLLNTVNLLDNRPTSREILVDRFVRDASLYDEQFLRQLDLVVAGFIKRLGPANADHPIESKGYRYGLGPAFQDARDIVAGIVADRKAGLSQAQIKHNADKRLDKLAAFLLDMPWDDSDYSKR